MANIPALPSADVLIAKGDATGSYGPHLWFVVADGKAALTTTNTEVVSGTKPHLAKLTPETVPYVNKFIAHTGQRVEKYWRSGEYRVVGGPKRARVAPTAKPKPPTQEQSVVATAKPYIEGAGIDAVVFDEVVAEVVQEQLAAAVIEQPSASEAPAPTFTIPPDAKHASDTDAIPGVEYPQPVKVKPAGKDRKGEAYVNVGGIVVRDSFLVRLQDALHLRKSGKVANVVITGPAGTAKTALVRAFAASESLPFLKIDGGSIRTADDWAGAFRQDPNTKTWSHRWSPFARVLRKGEPCVVLIDEGNRTESPQALNALLGLLDWSGSLTVPDANATLKLPPGILVVMTANIGPEFVGTLPLDGAVRQRFGYGIRMDYPPEDIEVKLLVERTGVTKDIAGKLVRMAASQRVNRDDPQLFPSGAVISTRVILDMAERIALRGADPRDAVEGTLEAQFDPADHEALSVVLDAQFPRKQADVDIEEVPADPLITVGKHWFNPGYPAAGPCGYLVEGAPCSKFIQDPIHLDND